jgi:hypothetical protein
MNRLVTALTLTLAGVASAADPPPASALKVESNLFLTLPGEPFVEYGFRLEKAIADRAVPVVVGYANVDIGYICTAKAFQEGATSRTTQVPARRQRRYSSPSR